MGIAANPDCLARDLRFFGLAYEVGFAVLTRRSFRYVLRETLANADGDRAERDIATSILHDEARAVKRRDFLRTTALAVSRSVEREARRAGE
jgi:hypothetical protein